MRKLSVFIVYLTAFFCLTITSATAQCIPPSILAIERNAPTGIYNVVFTYQQPGTYYFEYGPVGFTPGSNASPGVGGTVSTMIGPGGVSWVNLPTNVTNITCYLRLYCNNSTWTANSIPFNYTTGTTTYVPALFTILGLNNTAYLDMNNPQYGGGLYSTCGWGFFQEQRLRFDCPDTSYYEVRVNYPYGIQSPRFAQKLLNAPVANYICEPVDGYSTYPNSYVTYYIGPLHKGKVYDFLFDAENPDPHVVSVTVKCPRPETITVSNINSTSVTFNWTCFCPDSVILEYGPTGFTPGTGALAGVNGTLISPVSPPYTLNGLSVFTPYDVYFRSACGGNYSQNKKLIIKTAKDCNTFPVISCNGIGQFNYAGNLAVRGAWDLGTVDSSEEKVYKFTPTVTGNYQMTVYNLTSGWTGYVYPAHYYYKDASACNEIGWTMIGTSSYSVPGFVTHSFTFGPLTAGTTYYIAGDGYTFTSYHSYTYSYQLQCLSCMPPSQPASITGATSYCSNASTTPLTYSVPVVAGVTSYSWVFPSGWVGSSTTNTITLTPNGVSGGNIICTPSNACGPGPAKTLFVSMINIPVLPTSISGSPSGCQGSTQVYSIPPVGGATSYIWTLPAGWSGTSTTTSITVTRGAAGGTLSVQGVNACGPGTARTLAVTVTPIPVQPNSIIGNSAVCANSSNAYSVDSVPGATSYQWILPAGWSGTSTTRFITVTSGTAGGTLSVTASNSCGTSPARTRTVSIAALPATPGSITAAGGNTKVCPGDVKNYSVVLVTSVTSYTWTSPPGSTITSGQGTNAVTVTYNAGFTASDTLGVKATNACGTSARRWIKITRNTPVTPGTMTGTTYGICGINNLPYSVPNVAGITYAWSSGAGTAVVQSGQGTNSAIFNFLPAFSIDTIKVAATNNCGISAFRKLTVRKIPANPVSIVGTNVPCSGQHNVPYSTAPVASAINYTWVGPAGSHIYDGVILSPSNTLVTTATNVTVNFGTTAGSVKVRANSSCGSSSYRTLTVTFTCRIGQQQDETSTEFKLLPNPASEKVTLNFKTDAPGRYNVYFTDITGKRVLETNGSALKGFNELFIDVEKLASGSYIVHLDCGTLRHTARLQVE